MRSEIKQRIEQIKRGEVPQGYKKTKIGIVPEEWKEYLFSDIFEPFDERTDDIEKTPLYSLTIEDGVTPKSERYERSFLVKKENSYKVVRQNDYVYNPMNVRFGAVARHKEKCNVSVSGYYDIFRSVDNRNNGFMDAFLISPKMISYYNKVSIGSLVEKQRVHFSQFLNFKLPLPTIGEREKIAEVLACQDRIIELNKRKVEELKKLKKAYLGKMFPKKGCDVPELRFKGFTDPWEQRKFKETVLIERGGSPRPIDSYITDSGNGLNWVKIGDAPEKGNYITNTAEKIKPEGLSKTREVHPGDLILSNSMSFGKPYIMGINGCIHDGWLLIRNENKTYDLTFLCHLLGTNQMLEQYRSLAAGSTVNNLNKELVGSTTVMYPNIDEQLVIGQFLNSLDNLITLHQRKVEELQNEKKALMQLLLTGIVRTV